ncbi:MAG: VTT domain-containing protein [Candidatus Pacebacteria bacterium]|nr:VTT domain-containing protein [Candidatus Paceibacterota bacterium]
MNQSLPDIANWIIGFGVTHDYLVYIAVAVIACAEGPWISLILGVLLRLGFFFFWPIYIALMIGDLVGDVIWYYIGRRYGHSFIGKHGHRFSITEAGVERMTRLFHKHKHVVLFLSKISNGLGFAIVTLMTAGMVKIPFGRYILVNMIGQLIWTGFLLGAGYFFSNLYVTIDNVLGKITLTVGLLVLAYIGYRYFKKLKNKAQSL